MKIAIVCDWLVTIGGAEKVLEQLLACYPDADLFSVVDFVDEANRHYLHNKNAVTTFIQKLPFAKKHYRNYLPLMPLAIERLDLSGYDLVISSSHAVAKGVKTSPSQIHICYIYTPMRYAWDLKEQYLHETGLNKKWYGFLVRQLLERLRKWDLKSAKGVNHFIAISNYIARRVENAYQRHADVIYPPVDIDKFAPTHKKEDFYFTASRMVPYKKMDLIVESFQHMPDKKLIVIGTGPDFEKIKMKAGSNVQLLGYQPNEVLVDYMQRAKAFIFAAEEDFGILPVEAQACGTPVIAYAKGGALETVRGLDDAKPTGVFFPEQTIDAIKAAVTSFEANHTKCSVGNCAENAERFGANHFRKSFCHLITQHLSYNQD